MAIALANADEQHGACQTDADATAGGSDDRCALSSSGSAPVLVSIVGFAKTGKTTLLCELLREARRKSLRSAIVKVAHHSWHDNPDSDTRRALTAGASISLYWSPASLVVERGTADAPDIERFDSYQPPERDSFESMWRTALPPLIDAEIARCELVLIEGRIAAGSRVIHTVRSNTCGERARPKYAPREGESLVDPFVNRDNIVQSVFGE